MVPIRLVAYEQFDGATNMAIDEAILECHLTGTAPPTVRLYGWNPAAVSIGYAQNLETATIARIREKGFDVVRRPTGGRAVLHADELTYSFVGSSIGVDGGFLQSTISGAYKQICAGLVLALEQIGVGADLGSANSSYRQMQDCFLATTTADLHYQGKKMVGSAQCRRGPGVLQHGSILLDQGQTQMDSLLTGGTLRTTNTAPRHANLFEVAGREFSLEELTEALRSGFERAFECKLVPGFLTKEELAMAASLRSKYLIDGATESNVSSN